MLAPERRGPPGRVRNHAFLLRIWLESRLVWNWRLILRKAWSIRLMIVAGLLSGLEVALPIIDQVASIPRGIFAALSGLTVGAAFVARLVAQKGTSNAEE